MRTTISKIDSEALSHFCMTALHNFLPIPYFHCVFVRLILYYPASFLICSIVPSKATLVILIMGSKMNLQKALFLAFPFLLN